MIVHEQLAAIADAPVPWLRRTATESSIVVSSRFRLARNLQGHHFPSVADGGQRAAILDRVRQAAMEVPLMRQPLPLAIDSLAPVDREILFERNLISGAHKEGKPGTAVLVAPSEECSIMVNEEDHLRIQVIAPGLQLPSLWERIDEIDNNLAKHLDFAFDPTLGYLTSCPSNVGTGLRASVMMHLPGLVLTDHIKQVVQALNRMGLAARGLFGEGSESCGSLFQISNQFTLGESEIGIITKLEKVVHRLLAQEDNARYLLIEQKRNELADRIGRAYGALSYARMLGIREALAHISIVRLGVDLGFIKAVSSAVLNEWIVRVQPGHLQTLSCRTLASDECDMARAEYIRRGLQNG